MDITVYLPDELGAQAKEADLPFSQMLRAAVQEELERRDVLAKSIGDPVAHVLDAETERGVAITVRFQGTHLAAGPVCDVYVTTEGRVVVQYHNTNTIDVLEEPAEELRDLLTEDDYVEAVSALGLRPIIEL